MHSVATVRRVLGDGEQTMIEPDRQLLADIADLNKTLTKYTLGFIDGSIPVITQIEVAGDLLRMSTRITRRSAYPLPGNVVAQSVPDQTRLRSPGEHSA